MSINVEAVRKKFESHLLAEEIKELNERIGWAEDHAEWGDVMLFTDRQVAHILQVSPRTIGRYVRAGQLTAIYLTPPNRTRRFTLPDVKDFLRRSFRG